MTTTELENLNRQTEARLIANRAAQTAQRRKEARKAAQNRRYDNQYIFLRRTYRTLLLPIATAILYLFRVMPLVPTVIVWIAAALFLIYNAFAYVTRNSK